MTTLRKLFLRWCTQVRDFGLQHVYSMRNLRVLSLAGCSLISSSGLSGLTCLRNLEELELTNCTNATPEVFEHLREYLPTCLIVECNHVTDIGVGYLSTMTTLRKLFLRWCTQVRDFGLQHVYSMRNLRVLSLAGCSLISSSGLSGLTCLRNLEELELTNCTNATPEVFEHLREYLPTCLIVE